MVYSFYNLRKGADTLSDSYRKLRGRIIEKYGTTGKFAEAIKCSRGTVSSKLNKKTDMSRKDMEIWLKALDIPEEKVHEYFW